MAAFELKNCPFCKGPVQFHQDDDFCPDSCHLIECKTCDYLIDIQVNDPEGESMGALQAVIAARWNTLATHNA